MAKNLCAYILYIIGRALYFQLWFERRYVYKVNTQFYLFQKVYHTNISKPSVNLLIGDYWNVFIVPW